MQDLTSTVTFDDVIPKIKRSSSVSAIFNTVNRIEEGTNHSNEVKLEKLEYESVKSELSDHYVDVRI